MASITARINEITRLFLFTYAPSLPKRILRLRWAEFVPYAKTSDSATLAARSSNVTIS